MSLHEEPIDVSMNRELSSYVSNEAAHRSLLVMALEDWRIAALEVEYELVRSCL